MKNQVKNQASSDTGTLIQIYRCMGWFSDGTPNRAQFWYFYNYY